MDQAVSALVVIAVEDSHHVSHRKSYFTRLCYISGEMDLKTSGLTMEGYSNLNW